MSDELTHLFGEAQSAKLFIGDAAIRIVDRALALSGGSIGRVNLGHHRRMPNGTRAGLGVPLVGREAQAARERSYPGAIDQISTSKVIDSDLAGALPRGNDILPLLLIAL